MTMDNFTHSEVVEVEPCKISYHIQFKNGQVVRIRRDRVEEFLKFLAGLARERGERPYVKTNITFLFGMLYE